MTSYATCADAPMQTYGHCINQSITATKRRATSNADQLLRKLFRRPASPTRSRFIHEWRGYSARHDTHWTTLLSGK